MKKVLMLACALIIGGCGYDSKVQLQQFDKGVELCEVNGGHDRFEISNRSGSETGDTFQVYCNNGAMFRYVDRYKRAGTTKVAK